MTFVPCDSLVTSVTFNVATPDGFTVASVCLLFGVCFMTMVTAKICYNGDYLMFCFHIAYNLFLLLQ